jgi:hypothetical protein
MAASSKSNGAPLLVFDFDKTIVDCDSDNWVVDALGATERFDELLLQLPWNYAIVSTHSLHACLWCLTPTTQGVVVNAFCPGIYLLFICRCSLFVGNISFRVYFIRLHTPT